MSVHRKEKKHWDGKITEQWRRKALRIQSLGGGGRGSHCLWSMAYPPPPPPHPQSFVCSEYSGATVTELSFTSMDKSDKLNKELTEGSESEMYSCVAPLMALLSMALMSMMGPLLGGSLPPVAPFWPSWLLLTMEPDTERSDRGSAWPLTCGA